MGSVRGNEINLSRRKRGGVEICLLDIIMKNELYLNPLKNEKGLKIIEAFKKIFRQEIDCDDLILDLIIECIKDLFLYFNGSIDSITKEDDPYEYYVFSGTQKGYTLLEFLLNRVLQNIEIIAHGVYSSNEYDLYHKEISINMKRYEGLENKYSKKTIAMFLKKSVYHETIHAIQSNPISFGDKNEFIKSANKKSEIEQKKFYFNRLEKYKKLNIKINEISLNELMNAECHTAPIACHESVNEYRVINEALVEMLANELSGLRQYVEELNINERIYFYEQSCDKQLALLLSDIENGYKYNSHFARLLLYLVGRKKFFLELFTQRKDLFLDLQKRKLVGDNFEEVLRNQFASTEGIYSIDNYLQFLTKYFYLYEELNTNDCENWLPLMLEEENYKGNRK